MTLSYIRTKAEGRVGKKCIFLKVSLRARGLRNTVVFTAASCLVLLTGLPSEGGPFRERIRERIKDRVQEKMGQRDQGKSKTDESQFQLIEGNGSSYQGSPYGTGNYQRYLNFGGRRRFYIIHVPSVYNKDVATPLVLNFHGGGGKPDQQRRDSGMDAVSDTGGFIVVYPAGTGQKQDRSFSWNSGIGDNYANKNNIDDVGFTQALLDDIEKFFHIDQKRIYATGFSNGGFMCYRLAAQLSEKIAAIAPVSGVMGRAYSRQPSRPISVLHFHGLKDTFVPYKGGSGRGPLENADLPSVEETINFWVDSNGCSKEPVNETRQGKAIRRQYGTGAQGAEVILWTLADGGHTWPGGKSSLPEWMAGKVNTDINASELIWEFFQRHPMP